MTLRKHRVALWLGNALLTLAATLPGWSSGAPDAAGSAVTTSEQRVEAGRRIYRDGVLSSGEVIAGTVRGDISLTGGQVVCGTCHRRSGLGSMEGQQVVPAVTGDILYQPLRLPTSTPPLAPTRRSAHTDETIKRAIRSGVGADGEVLSALMPRYALSDEDLDSLIAYLKTLNTDPDPGVSEGEIHFATIVGDSVDPATRKAFLDVFDVFIAQKNSETRHESARAEHGPWHKQWQYAAYRKWVLHVWDVKGPPESWPAQLQTQYQEQPVFAVLSGMAPGSWQPVHDFCEQHQVPCLFPNTDLPVVDERGFYSVYLSQGMTLEADAIARHLFDDGLLALPVVQVYRAGDPRGEAAATELRRRLELDGGRVTDLRVTDASVLTEDFWRSAFGEKGRGTAVVWLEPSELGALWKLDEGGRAARLYLSTTLYGVDPAQIPPATRDRVYLVHPYELPSKLPRLLARSTGWLKANRIYAPDAQLVQGNAYFALKMAGTALVGIRGFFVREYLLERFEHLVDRATYTSVYPRISLAPGQRIASRAAYIARFPADASGKEDLTPVRDWAVPRSN
jgi:hypothetical protein